MVSTPPESVSYGATDSARMWLQPKAAETEVVTGTREVLFIERIFYEHDEIPAVPEQIARPEIEDMVVRGYERKPVRPVRHHTDRICWARWQRPIYQ